MTISRYTKLHCTFVSTIHEYFTMSFNEFSSHNIHPGQLMILREIRDHEGCTQNYLAKKLHVKPATVAVSMKRMEKLGYIRRSGDEKDRRVLHVYLTEVGEDFCEQMMTIQRRNEEVLFHSFTNEEEEEFLRLLTKIKDNIHEAKGEKENA